MSYNPRHISIHPIELLRSTADREEIDHNFVISNLLKNGYASPRDVITRLLNSYEIITEGYRIEPHDLSKLKMTAIREIVDSFDNATIKLLPTIIRYVIKAQPKTLKALPGWEHQDKSSQAVGPYA